MEDSVFIWSNQRHHQKCNTPYQSCCEPTQQHLDWRTHWNNSHDQQRNTRSICVFTFPWAASAWGFQKRRATSCNKFNLRDVLKLSTTAWNMIINMYYYDINILQMYLFFTHHMHILSCAQGCNSWTDISSHAEHPTVQLFCFWYLQQLKRVSVSLMLIFWEAKAEISQHHMFSYAWIITLYACLCALRVSFCFTNTSIWSMLIAMSGGQTIDANATMYAKEAIHLSAMHF